MSPKKKKMTIIRIVYILYIPVLYVYVNTNFLSFGILFPGDRGFFLTLSAAGHSRGPSVHYDACQEPG